MTIIPRYKDIKKEFEAFKQNLPTDEFEKLYGEFNFAKRLLEASKCEELPKEELDELAIIKQTRLSKLHKLGYKKIR
ncbi:hypothetical protein IJC60_05355 [bacterium]|nr:hypothetical protein [bacterium]